jgi:hypothetical protein
MWKPDILLPIANAITELINSKPRSPSREEVQAVLRGGYFTVYVVLGRGTIENCREAIESVVAYRTDAILSLINSRPRSPTTEEIKSVLR